MTAEPLVTVAIPSFNQGRYLDVAIASVFAQDLPVEVIVADGGSSDDSVSIIKKWAPKLLFWSSGPDRGQAAAINEAIARGSAPFVCWVNSDDWLLPGGLRALHERLKQVSAAPAAYGRVDNYKQTTQSFSQIWVQPFSRSRLALRCIVSQPGTLIRREAWDEVGGLDADLKMTMDYDLWWKLFNKFGPLEFIDQPVAVNREHEETKTARFRKAHYAEAIATVRKHNGSVPLKWYFAQPYAVWYKSALASLRELRAR